MQTLFAAFVLLSSFLFPLSAFAQDASRDQLKRAIALEQTGVLMEAVSTYEDYLKSNPGDAGARGRLIGLLIRMEEKQRAIPHIAILRRLAPDNPQYSSFYAIEDDYRLNVEAAQEKDYETRVKGKDVTPATLLEYSKFLAAKGDEKGSMEMLRRYVEAKPNDFAARLDLAKRYSWKKQLPEARRHATAAANLNPDNVEAATLSGDLAWWQGDEEAALAAYRRGSAAAPANKELKAKISKIVDAPGYREKKMIEALKKDPTSKVNNDLAKYYLDQNREWEADSLVQARLKAVPDDKDALKLAEDIQKKKVERYNKQIRAYKNRLEVAPKDTTVLLALARYYASLPNLDSSIAIYDRYMKLFPLDYRIRLERATVLKWNGRTGEAAVELRVISVAQPANNEAAISLAECLVMEDINIDEAEGIFIGEMVNQPDSIRPRIGYADALRRQGRYDEALEQYKAVLARDPENERAKVGLEYIDRDLSPVVRRLEKKVEQHPEDFGSRRRLAGLYYDAKRYWDAEQQINILLAEKPNDTQLKAFQNDIRNRSKVFRTAALDSLQREVAAQPENNVKRRQLADELAGIGRTDEAISQYNMLLAQNPDDNEIKLKIVEILLAGGKMKEASAILLDVADNNPGNFEYRFRLAQILSWMADYEGATREYEAAMRINPNSVECQVALADIARWRGDPYTAYDTYSKILAMNPSNTTARNAMNDLKGTLVRGAQGSLQQAEDSEHFRMQETRASVSVNLSLRMRAQAGPGKIHFEQKDAILGDLYAETGWFLYGQLDYRIDPLTRASGQIKYYTFALKKSQAIRLEVEHDFKDMPSLIGLIGTAYYSSQEAVLDLASSRNLLSWTQNLRSEKLGAYVTYNYSPKWVGEGEVGLFAISDGNTRTDLQGELRRVFSKLLQMGVRYENISAKRSFNTDGSPMPYWSPAKYQTISAVAQLQNSFNRWSYEVHGGVGRVLGTDDALRNFSAQIQWRLAQSVYFSAGILDLATTRVDGEYHYRGLQASLTVER